MTIISQNNIEERKYVLDIVFNEFLGLEYDLVISNLINFFSEELEDIQYVKSITVNGKNITKKISKICNNSGNSLYLKKILVEYLATPKQLVNVIESTEIRKIYFGKESL